MTCTYFPRCSRRAAASSAARSSSVRSTREHYGPTHQARNCMSMFSVILPIGRFSVSSSWLMSFGPTTVQLASCRALTCGRACQRTPSQICEPITQRKCWRAVLQAHFSYSMDLHGIAIPQTPQTGRAGLFKERSFPGVDVQELTSQAACNQRHARDSIHSPNRCSVSDRLRVACERWWYRY